MVRTGRDLVLLRKPKNSKPKEPTKPKDDIKKAIEHKRKDMGKIRKKVRDRGRDRRLEAELEKISSETEELKEGITRFSTRDYSRDQNQPDQKPDSHKNLPDDWFSQSRCIQPPTPYTLLSRCKQGSFTASLAQSIEEGIKSPRITRHCLPMVPLRALV